MCQQLAARAVVRGLLAIDSWPSEPVMPIDAFAVGPETLLLPGGVYKWKYIRRPAADEGRKADAGKTRLDLLPPKAEMAVGEVLTFGARKYAPDNWRAVPDAIRRYTAAAMRHLNAVRQGETLDAESGLTHLAHAICCLMFRLELELEAKEADATGVSSAREAK